MFTPKLRVLSLSFAPLFPSVEGSSHPRVTLFAKLSGIPISDEDRRQFRPFALTDYFLPIVRSLVRCDICEQTSLVFLLSLRRTTSNPNPNPHPQYQASGSPFSNLFHRA